jgi:hypothetical protein
MQARLWKRGGKLPRYSLIRLAGAIRAGETIPHRRRRKEGLDGRKPKFEGLERGAGGEAAVQAERLLMLECCRGATPRRACRSRVN